MKKIRKEFLVYHMTNGYCFYCPEKAGVIDHFIPKVEWKKGGYMYGMEEVSLYFRPNDFINLVPACADCNAHKSSNSAAEFMVALIGPEYIDLEEAEHYIQIRHALLSSIYPDNDALIKSRCFIPCFN